VSSTPDWPTVLLKDLQAPKKYALNGGPFGSKLGRRDYVPRGVPVIRGANLSDDSRFNFGDFVYVTEDKADELLPNNAHPGDLIFTQRGTLGQVGIIQKDCGHDRFVISQSQMKLTVDESKAAPYFLYYYFRAPDTVHTIAGLAISSGVPHINLDTLRHFEVKLPPLPTQRKIAAILSAYDDLIENNTRRIAILGQMARFLYREWFVHFRFPDHEDVEMVDSDLWPIPEGWQVGAFSDLAVIKRDNVRPDESEDETFEYYSFPAFDSNRMPAFERGAEIRSNKYLVHRGSVLLSKLNPHIPRVWLPFPDTEHRAVASTEFLILLPKEPFTCEYLFGLCNSQDFLQRFASLATGTSTSHQRVKPRSLQNMQVPLPSRDLVQEFGSLATPVFGAIYTLQSKNAILSRTRDLLLPRLISGELDVSELAIDVGEEDDH
jgi:type I restriction enzyme S subunit